MNNDISVLMTVYKNDIPENVKTAVDSIENQTLVPKQVVMVVDGPVSDEHKIVLNNLQKKYDNFEVYYQEKNLGLGNTLKNATKYCKCDFIARMDSDDISRNDRFEKEMAEFENDSMLDMVGSNIQEFFDNLDNLAGIRSVPETDSEIKKFIKSRNPFCHMTVMMKKSMLEKAGGYEHWFYAEDWYLWIRMYLAGAKFKNVQENLVYARINYDTFSRRGGLKYFKSLKNLLKFMKDNKMIGTFKYFKELAKRFVGHVLIPRKLKSKLYMKFLRKK